MERINFALTLQVIGGPSLPISGVLEVDAYEKIDVTVPPKVGSTNGTVDVVVSAGALADVKLLAVKASALDGSVFFKTSAAGAADIPITGPVTLIGGTACGLLGTAPDQITFSNSAASEAGVTILVGRNAVT